MKKLLFSSTLFLSVFVSIVAQTTNSDTITSDFKIGEIARALVDQKQFITLPSEKGKEKYKIDENSKEYILPDGPSKVALFKLPEFKQPYILVIKSWRNGLGIKFKFFIPSGVFLDKSFQPTSTLLDSVILEADRIYGMVLVNAFLMDENRKDDHYLFTYTHRSGDVVGNFKGSPFIYQDIALDILANSINHPIEGTPEGKLELIVIPFDTLRTSLISNAQAKKADVYLRRASIIALGKTNDDSVIPDLEEIVLKNDDDLGIRMVAIVAISTIHSKQAIESLTRVAQNNRIDKDIRSYASQALKITNK